jgi:hypothetical protein
MAGSSELIFVQREGSLRPTGRQGEERTVKEHGRKTRGNRASWTVGALGIVLAYFGMFGVLMYPVIRAAGYV